MSQTVIGVFESGSTAQQAIDQLTAKGITRDNIDVSSQSSTGDATSHSSDDSIGGFFRNLFDSDDEANTYSQVARRGTVITVHAQSPQLAENARDILDQCGAVDVNERAQYYQQNSGQQNNLAAGTQTGQTSGAIPIIEENLQVGKRVVETGGARLRSRIIERPVEEHLRLREEHVHVERTAVNRPATEADLRNFQEGEIEITEHAEVPVVSKEARVVGEVTLGKEVQERDETVRDTVRRTDVEVEQLRGDDVNRRTSTDNDTNRQS
ncbi:YsnF/AvaK domain-containing protein [Hymenobacter sp. BT175]|uniref:YsnF/AvaK domain-containing protein n=1 Tax=Hymenobacter translucens TaxID=2886507 RepID=UPI001D0E1979|nr:YsnF/AvaK domain-containing protein [Hymenobacter translucens]MCC2546775.1 YsnF/AvaK domain-containing protein [Hymenobacter translucens]